MAGLGWPRLSPAVRGPDASLSLTALARLLLPHLRAKVFTASREAPAPLTALISVVPSVRSPARSYAPHACQRVLGPRLALVTFVANFQSPLQADRRQFQGTVEVHQES